jgi:hypothetical protein
MPNLTISPHYTVDNTSEFIKNVKHQFRKLGYGRLNIVRTTEHDLTVGLRETDRTYVNERRSELLKEIAEKSHVFFDGFVVSIAVEDHLLERNVIEKSRKRIDILEKKLDNCVTVVYQLLGGLYNQRTQGNRLNEYISILFDRPMSTEREDTGGEWPTTRQGDKTEAKLGNLIEELRKRIPDIEI